MAARSFEIGQITSIEVMQAGAQVAASRQQSNVAEAALRESSSDYLAVVGVLPGNLFEAPDLPNLPLSIDDAFAAAEHFNPTLLKAVETARQSREKTNGARAANRPSLPVQGVYGASGPLDPFATRLYDRSLNVTAEVAQPTSAGGANAASVRSAIDQESADRIGVEVTRRAVDRDVAHSFALREADTENVALGRTRVVAAKSAYDGMASEYAEGLRTLFELILAEQQYQQAEIDLITATHDRYIADAALLRSTGLLEARYLYSGIPLYDPRRAFDRAKNKGAVPWESLVLLIDAAGMQSDQLSGVDEPQSSQPAEASMTQKIRPPG